MELFSYFSKKVNTVLTKLAKEKNIDINFSLKKVGIEFSKKTEHGDISTNVAMVFAKDFKISPLVLAEIIQEQLIKIEEIEKIEIIKPGFINLFIRKEFWQNQLLNVLKYQDDYGKENIGQKEKINIEYVSANPTGPLHIGHGRGAVIGSSLANLYRYFGYDVTEEYWLNDLGNQVDALGKSLYFRYLELFNQESKIKRESNFYPGEYLIDTAKDLQKECGDIWLDKKEEEWLPFMKEYAIDKMVSNIKADLITIGVDQDVFSSEKAIATDEAYQLLVAKLEKDGFIYQGILDVPKGKVVEDFEPREQKLFRTTLYGDDIDRPLEKSNGEKTYFASDVVYHNQKVQRGFSKLINVLGADHIGYEKRLQAVVAIASAEKVPLEAIFCQMVNIKKDGNQVRMSKRAGNFIALSDVVTEIGKDAFRFMMFTRKNDVSLDLDLSLLKEQKSDNPVFYIQYAYARINSVLENAEKIIDLSYDKLLKADFFLLQNFAEIGLMKSVLRLPSSLMGALINNDLHRIYLYLENVASNFHFLWNQGKENAKLRFIIPDDEELTLARLSLLKASAIGIKIALDILAIDIKKHM